MLILLTFLKLVQAWGWSLLAGAMAWVLLDVE